MHNNDDLTFKISSRNALEVQIERILTNHSSVAGKELRVWIYDTEDAGMADMVIWKLVDMAP